MRLHISLDDELVAQLDKRVGPRGRSAFIAESVARALDEDTRWDDILDALGSDPNFMSSVTDTEGWVREQRFGDERRVG